MYNIRDIDRMLISMSIHKKDSKRMVKSNFFTSCLDFKGSMSIPLVKQTNTNGETKQETLQIKRKTLNFLTY